MHTHRNGHRDRGAQSRILACEPKFSRYIRMPGTYTYFVYLVPVHATDRPSIRSFVRSSFLSACLAFLMTHDECPISRMWSNFNKFSLCPKVHSSCPASNVSSSQSCSHGYRGVLCGICADGYYSSSEYNRCASCKTSDWIIPIVLTVVILLALFIGFYWYRRKYGRPKFKSKTIRM